MNLFRGVSIVLTQLPLLYFELGRRDLLGGFNQTDDGFSLLIGLFVVVPLANLVWLVFETTRSFRLVRDKGFRKTVLLPFVSLLFLLESLAINLYLLSYARM